MDERRYLGDELPASQNWDGTGWERETRLPLCHKKTTWQIICWEIGGVLLKTPHMTLKQYALGNIDSDHIWSIFKKI